MVKPSTVVASPAEVVAFWFAPTVRPLWFAATPDFDELLRARFLATYRAAAAGQLTDWETTAEGALARVIVLDQFPLNLFPPVNFPVMAYEFEANCKLSESFAAS